MSNRASATAAREESAKGVLLEWPKRRLDPNVHVYCAYNPSRESFLCSFVEPVDVMPENLREHLDKLTPGSHKAIWLVPFRGIAADHLDAPIDLIFLDQNYCVLAMTQSFPVSNPCTCSWPVGSAIALPPGSIATSGTLAGDQVILCSPQKMKRRLSELQKSTQDGREPETLSHNAYSVSHSVSSEFRADARISNWDDVLKQAPLEHSAIVPAGVATRTSDQHKLPQANSSWSRNWLFCVLAPHRKEKRKSPRESLPWVAAYFSTGGTPAPATICNISSLGMYVKTSERWYPGTIIQVTLSDWRLPSTDRVVTVNAMAVRSDDLAVGLRFVFPKQRRGRANPQEDAAMTGVTREQLREFLEHCREKGRHFSWHRKR